MQGPAGSGPVLAARLQQVIVLAAIEIAVGVTVVHREDALHA